MYINTDLFDDSDPGRYDDYYYDPFSLSDSVLDRIVSSKRPDGSDSLSVRLVDSPAAPFAQTDQHYPTVDEILSHPSFDVTIREEDFPFSIRDFEWTGQTSVRDVIHALMVYKDQFLLPLLNFQAKNPVLRIGRHTIYPGGQTTLSVPVSTNQEAPSITGDIKTIFSKNKESNASILGEMTKKLIESVKEPYDTMDWMEVGHAVYNLFKQEGRVGDVDRAERSRWRRKKMIPKGSDEKKKRFVDMLTRKPKTDSEISQEIRQFTRPILDDFIRDYIIHNHPENTTFDDNPQDDDTFFSQHFSNNQDNSSTLHAHAYSNVFGKNASLRSQSRPFFLSSSSSDDETLDDVWERHGPPLISAPVEGDSVEDSIVE